MALIIRAGSGHNDIVPTDPSGPGLLDPAFVQDVLKGYPEFSQLSSGVTLNGIVYDRVLVNEEGKHSDLSENKHATALLEDQICLEGPIIGDVLLLTSGEYY